MGAQKPKGVASKHKPSTAFRGRDSEVIGGGARLAMPKAISASGTSSLKPGSGATEGVLEYRMRKIKSANLPGTVLKYSNA